MKLQLTKNENIHYCNAKNYFCFNAFDAYFKFNDSGYFKRHYCIHIFTVNEKIIIKNTIEIPRIRK